MIAVDPFANIGTGDLVMYTGVGVIIFGFFIFIKAIIEKVKDKKRNG